VLGAAPEGFTANEAARFVAIGKPIKVPGAAPRERFPITLEGGAP